MADVCKCSVVDDPGFLPYLPQRNGISCLSALCKPRKIGHSPLSNCTGRPKFSARSVPMPPQREQPTTRPLFLPLHGQFQRHWVVLGSIFCHPLRLVKFVACNTHQVNERRENKRKKIVPIVRLKSRLVCGPVEPGLVSSASDLAILN